MLSAFLTSVITSASVSALLTAALVWITKSVISARLINAIKSEYEQKLETHKAQLKAQADVELERVKSAHQISSIEHEAKFNRLHERRAEVIAQTYGKLKILFAAVQDYTKAFEPTGDLPREERRKIAASAYEEFRNYYIKHLIFLPRKTADDLESINTDILRALNKFMITVDQSPRDPGSFDRWMEILDKLDGDVKSSLTQLEDAFRELLGEPR